jgi:hypothetical protein
VGVEPTTCRLRISTSIYIYAVTSPSDSALFDLIRAELGIYSAPLHAPKFCDKVLRVPSRRMNVGPIPFTWKEPASRRRGRSPRPLVAKVWEEFAVAHLQWRSKNRSSAVGPDACITVYVHSRSEPLSAAQVRSPRWPMPSTPTSMPLRAIRPSLT